MQFAYYRIFGRPANLLQPKRFNEKIQWRKLFDRNPLFAVLSDKIAVRDFIAGRVGAQFLVPSIWAGDTPDAIPFEQLQLPYVLKCCHGSGMNVLVTENNNSDRGIIRETLRQYLSRNFGAMICEPGYIDVPPRIIAERLLLQPDGAPPLEHKMFAFEGRVRIIQTMVVTRDRKRFSAVHDRDWNRLDWRFGPVPNLDGALARPERLTEIVGLAEQLSAGFDFVRVDSYDWAEGVRFGEMTLYQNSGLIPLQPDSADFLLGMWWPLENAARRALSAYLGC